MVGWSATFPRQRHTGHKGKTSLSRTHWQAEVGQRVTDGLAGMCTVSDNASPALMSWMRSKRWSGI